MKHTLTALLALALVGIGQCQNPTHISVGASGEAVGPSVAVFVPAGTLSPIIRIAFLDGVSGGDAGTALHIRDYSASMTLLGSRTIDIDDANSPKFTRPGLSRDGRGVVFFGSVDDGGDDNPSTPFYALLSASWYSGTGTVNAVVAPYSGVDDEGDLGSSTELFAGYDPRPPAISNYDGGFHIVFADLVRDPFDPEESNAPLMHWDTSNSVDDVYGTNFCLEPGINADGDILIFREGIQVIWWDGGAGTWDDTNEQIVSEYNGTAGNYASEHAQIDADGDTVVFVTNAENLRAEDENSMRDVYVWEYNNGSPTLTLAYNDPGQFNGHNTATDHPSISADGAYVSFQSGNQNFLSGTVDYQYTAGVCVYRVAVGSPSSLTIMSRAPLGAPIPAKNGTYGMAADGGRVVFMSGQTGLADNDGRAGTDIYYRG